MKIQEPLYQFFSLADVDLAKKIGTPSIRQSENMTDSYVSGADFSDIEKEVFQVLKAIISDLKNTIDMLHGDNQNVVFPDISVKSSEKSVLPVPEHKITMLFLSGKGEAPENPARVLLSYRADKSLPEMPFSPQLIEKAVEEAKLIVKTLAGKGVFVLQDTKEESADAVGAGSGFVLKFSFISGVVRREPAVMSQSSPAPPAQEDGMTQAHEWIGAYHVSGKAIDSQSLNILSLHDGEGGEILEKLLGFISGTQPDQKRAEGNEENGILREDQTAGQIENVENVFELKKMRIELTSQATGKENNLTNHDKDIENAIELGKIQAEAPLRSACKENNFIVVSLDAQEVKDEVAHAKDEPVIKTSVLINNDEGELGGTILNTGFGQGELKSSPVAGFPLLPFDNNVIISKIATFIERLNRLVTGDGTIDEVLDETMTGGTAPSDVSLEKLRLLQTRSPEIRTAIQNIRKRIFADFENIPDIQLTGLSLGKNGSLRLDTSILASQLTSGKDETVNTMKGLANTIYERINYLMHPCAGIYVKDKNILQLKAVQKDESASLPDRELSKEQSALEKRFNELKLLIESSRLLAEWFTNNGAMSSNGGEATSGDT